MSEKKLDSVSRRTFLRATGVAGATAAVGGVTVATPGREPGPKENEVLVGVSVSAGDLEDVISPHVPSSGKIAHKNENLRYAAVRFPSEAPEVAQQNFIDAITGRPGVKYAEVNGTYEAFYTPSDPRFSDQYAPQMVNADDAWDTTLGSLDVTIAVIDTGVQYTHSDLYGNFRSDPGYDFVDDDAGPYPDNKSTEYHGTHVSGIAGAITDNGTGVAGISNSTLINGRALDENGGGSYADVADAIEWAADEGADIINMSLGGGASTTVESAVSYAQNQGSLIVAAAGNGYGASVSYPAAYPECVAVSALDSDATLASYSNVGSQVELCAPGTDVLSTTTNDRGSYEKLSGTSMATPVVSGVAGLALARWDLTNSQVRSHLNQTAVGVGLPASQQGNGRVDAFNAVTTLPSSCGNTSVDTVLQDSLSDSLDTDCWFRQWEFTSPCQVVVDLSGPTSADFDLYVNEGRAQCPTQSDYDYRGFSADSQETITINDPDTSTPLYVMVDSWNGSGDYTLTITEKGT